MAILTSYSPITCSPAHIINPLTCSLILQYLFIQYCVTKLECVPVNKLSDEREPNFIKIAGQLQWQKC